MRTLTGILLAMGLGGGAWAQQTSVVLSPHNLSAAGPGAVRAITEDEVCIFCHAPHNSAPTRPLWNRATPVDAYQIYSSRALDALPGQPTGASKMCLSCHDGTIALGSVLSRGTPIAMAGGVGAMPAGHGNVGTDLRDDHPVSFSYDAALASRDLKLRGPGTLPASIRLDANSEMQCTTCHDAHNNALGKFLVMQNANSEMCVSCHTMGSTNITGHANCSDCHQPHTAPSGPYLLKGATIRGTCVGCHGGSIAGVADIHSDLKKPYTHETNSPVDPPDPQDEHVSCVDCHEPHTMTRGAAPAPGLHPNFGAQSGMNISGTLVSSASSEFEVCFKCHADGTTRSPRVPRQIVQNNTRLEFAPSAVSFHPVAAQGVSSDVPSLRPGWTTSSRVACSDCHASESGVSAGGIGPSGTHGSAWPGLLAARYETADNTSESAAAYALCYACHDRTSILNDVTFKEHRKHIVEERAPCAACHDAHGISSAQGNATNNSRLINFAAGIVSPNSVGRLEFRATGSRHGTCFLRCHGENHNPESY